MVNIHTARTALYRLYDADDQLLYVGITNMPNVRLAAHRGRGWWHQVARTEVEWYETRQPAAQAEVRAIQEEWPLYNVTNSPRRSPIRYIPDS